MVDGVDQRFPNHGGAVGRVEHEGSVRCEQLADAGHHVAQIVQVGEGVVGDDQPRAAMGLQDLAG